MDANQKKGGKKTVHKNEDDATATSSTKSLRMGEAGSSSSNLTMNQRRSELKLNQRLLERREER